MKIHKITFVLLIIGGLNWGLEAFNYGIGQYIPNDTATMVIYILIALAAVYEIFSHKGLCRNCS